MPMSSGGHVASSSGCVTRPKAREIGSTGYAVPIQPSSPIGRYVMATAEHREPCDSRGSCTVLGAPGGEIPPGDSTKQTSRHHSDSMSALPPEADKEQTFRSVRLCQKRTNALQQKRTAFDHLVPKRSEERRVGKECRS